MAKNKFDRNNKNNTKGQETMGARIEDTEVKASVDAIETEGEVKLDIGAENLNDTEAEQVGSLGDNIITESEDLDAVDSKVDEPAEGGEKDMAMEAEAGASELDEIEKEDLSLIQTPPPVDTDTEIEQLKDSAYPPVLDDAESDEFKINENTVDITTLVFNKKTINSLIANYMEGDIVLDANTSILNSEENQKARLLITTLNTLNTAGGDKAETRILSYLALFLEPTDSPKNPGMLMQLIAKEINDSKTTADLDMAMYILTRIFTNVASFNIRTFLKIGNDYSAAFKVDALQMVEAFSQLATADDRKKKIGAIISLQKTFKTSTSFLSANGAKLMIEYFSK